MNTPYRNESCNPKYNAQMNLQGRTHYVDDDTLKFHKSRVLNTFVTNNGLLFGIVESYAVDCHNSTRAFRPVIFNIFGNVVTRCKLEDGFKSSNQAIKAFWNDVNKLDARKITLDEVEHQRKWHERELQTVVDHANDIAAQAL